MGQSGHVPYQKQEKLHLDWINGMYADVYHRYGGTPIPVMIQMVLWPAVITIIQMLPLAPIRMAVSTMPYGSIFWTIIATELAISLPSSGAGILATSFIMPSPCPRVEQCSCLVQSLHLRIRQPSVERGPTDH